MIGMCAALWECYMIASSSNGAASTKVGILYECAALLLDHRSVVRRRDGAVARGEVCG
jgi:hypothetical protein